jgi:hypothetical protein
LWTVLTGRRSKLVWVVVVLAGVLVVGAWAVIRGDPVRSRPEIDLVYPGSTEVLRQETATATRLMLSSDASSDQILAFYRSNLEGRGFGFAGGANVPSTTEDFACAWQNGGHIVRLAFMDLDALDPEFVVQHMTGKATLYRWSVIEGEVLSSPRPCNILLEGDPVPS